MKLLVFLLVLSFQGARADVAEICHRASPNLECAYLKYQEGLNLYALAKLGKYLYSKDMSIRYGVMAPTGEILGDVLYIHGFADRLDNHVPLFKEFNARGFRVISFDLPGHGENFGNANEMGDWTFTELTHLAATVESHVVRTSGLKPPRLFLAGWSTGGLIALRLAQGLSINRLSRNPNGSILYAPGVAVQSPWNLADKSTGFAWGLVGKVTQESLTHHPNPPHNGPIKPTAPALHVRFGLDLLWNSTVAQAWGLFFQHPTLIFAGGETEDLYADTRALKMWTWEQQGRGTMTTLVVCDQGRHELDNEAEPMGESVRKISGEFLSLSLQKEFGVYFDFKPAACRF